MWPFFLSAADTNAIVLLLVQHPIQSLRHRHKDISQDDFMVFLRTGTATSTSLAPCPRFYYKTKNLLCSDAQKKNIRCALTAQERTSFLLDRKAVALLMAVPRLPVWKAKETEPWRETVWIK